MLILLLAVSVVIGFAFDALMLHATTKIFKINGANYRTALIVSVIQCLSVLITGLILGMILNAVGIKSIGTILAILLGFAIFHKLLQRLYQTNLKTNIAIYAVYAIITVIISLGLVMPIRSFVAEPYYMLGASMEPAYYDNDYLLINKFDKSYQRGDVIVFYSPANPKQALIKRIVGLPGEKVKIKEDSVFIYDKQNQNGYKLSEAYLKPDVKTRGLDENIVELGNNEYYVLGDNRNASKDSRSIGPVKDGIFVGKVWFRVGLK